MFTRLVGLSPPGTFENLPRLSIPLRRFFWRVIHVKDDTRPFRTFSTSWMVCFPHIGHIDLTFFGIFKFITDYGSYVAILQSFSIAFRQQNCFACTKFVVIAVEPYKRWNIYQNSHLEVTHILVFFY